MSDQDKTRTLAGMIDDLIVDNEARVHVVTAADVRSLVGMAILATIERAAGVVDTEAADWDAASERNCNYLSAQVAKDDARMLRALARDIRALPVTLDCEVGE